jgi:CTP:molybdopterin cytidylyltransferase MocA
LKKGDTFHAQSPSSTKPHLYVVLTDPDTSGNVVIVNLTSQSRLKDQSCILAVGDHPFIKHETVVNYADALISNEEAILAGVRGGAVRHDPVPVSAAVLDRIQRGALDSLQTEAKVKALVRAALGPDTELC